MKEVQSMGSGDAAVLASADFILEGASAVSEGWFQGVPELEDVIFEVPKVCEVKRRAETLEPVQRPHPWLTELSDETSPQAGRRRPKRFQSPAQTELSETPNSGEL